MIEQKQGLIRQGDVLLIPTARKPSTEAKYIVDNVGRVILAYGEATGHAHEVLDIVSEDPDPVPAMELFEEPDGSRLLVIKRKALLRHEEHDPISLDLGNYEVRRQNEYNPIKVRQVAD